MNFKPKCSSASLFKHFEVKGIPMLSLIKIGPSAEDFMNKVNFANEVVNVKYCLQLHLFQQNQ